MAWTLRGDLLPENNVDFYEQEDAEVPDPFSICDEDHIDDGMHSHSHAIHNCQKIPSLPLVKAPPFPTLDDLPSFVYQPIDVEERDEIRILVLMPHCGHPSSPLQCHLITSSLIHDHYCYLYCENTRGYPYATSRVMINSSAKEITKNMEVFLRSMRKRRHPLLLWIREICINRNDPVERAKTLNIDRLDWILRHSCTSMNVDAYLNGILKSLIKQGLVSGEDHTSQKSWDSFPSGIELRRHFPRHFPIHLGTWRGPDAPPLPHRYMPLDPISREIRLVVLLGAQDPSAPLEAHLAHEPLSEDVIYQCLSYTWGSSDRTSQIILNGQILPITRNLDEALRSFRQPDGKTVFWIDSICIDQENNQEKSQQVGRMHAIYHNSASVVVWIGATDETSRIVMKFINDLNDGNIDLFQKPCGDNDRYELKKSWDLARAWSAFFRLLQRPYFQRLWIIQEIAAATLPTVYCGNEHCGWFALCNVVSIFLARMESIKEMWLLFPEESPTEEDIRKTDILSIHQLNFIRKAQIADKTFGFLTLACLTRYTDCSDPRDKIYALMNISKDQKLLNTQPDYSSPLAELYVSVVKSYVRNYKNLDIICAAQYHADNGLPSWCPDWRQKPSFVSMVRRAIPVDFSGDTRKFDEPIYCASRATKSATMFLFNDSSLVCGGIPFDEIEYIDHTGNPNDWYKAALKKGDRDGNPVDFKQVDAEISSMMLGDASGRCHSDVSLVDGELTTDTRQLAIFSPQPDGVIFRPEVQSPYVMPRCFIITKRGFFGLASHQVEVGMQVCILLGCSAPVILEEHETHWHFRGAAYVQGLMRGEGLDELGGSDEEIFAKVMRQQPFEIR